jgi:hypothetical protein
MPSTETTQPARRAAALGALRLALLAMACLPSVAAAQLNAMARQEIDTLLRVVGDSGCELLRLRGAAPQPKH